MSTRNNRSARGALLAGCAAIAVGTAAFAGAAQAQEAREYSIAGQDLDGALRAFAMESGHDVVFAPDLVRGKRTAGVQGRLADEAALGMLLADSGLRYEQTSSGGFAIVQAGSSSSPQDASADAGSAIEALIVTAQKREEAIQDVPIAISAFSQKSLEEQKIEGGYDLLRAIPNVTFSKSNFTSYNFSIRGVGTKAISATTDPGVAVSFNNTALIQNRLFEQEYFDVERVEVLRGPQGTLYGRNATSGVINVISAKPDLAEFKGSVKVEAGNYDSRRIQGMVNVPLIEDVLAVRLAGAATQRSGYDFNSATQRAVNGRDLWSGRLTVGFEPTPSFRANLIWEHFKEDDNRSRTGKQLCHFDEGPEKVGNATVEYTAFGQPVVPERLLIQRAQFSQGCKAGNLYADAAFGTPNGLAIPFILGPIYLSGVAASIGFDPNVPGFVGNTPSFLQNRNPYGGLMQSADLREIASIRDPIYRASADVVELSFDFDITEALTFTSQTAYNEDETYSFQDYNRFNSVPMFTDTSALTARYVFDPNLPSEWAAMAPRPVGSPLGTAGVFCDPQIGCTDKIAGFDISTAIGKQFSQEFRLQSSFDGSFNFSAGVNFTRFKTLVDYYVMFNVLTAIAQTPPFIDGAALGITNNTYLPGMCTSTAFGAQGGVVIPSDDSGCIYVDPNPLESMNGEGHNYFRSKNPYMLKSWAGFGEAYWNITPALKLTAGLRYTNDEKRFIPVPSQVLLSPNQFGGGLVSKGYPEKPAINQKWGEYTGRLGLDWQPELGFTDQTLLYGFYSRGYKAGGANPPHPGFATTDEYIQGALAAGVTQADIDWRIAFGYFPILELTAVEYGETFEPEFVDAFELGSKNTLLGGAMTLNGTAFYYDYKDYQVSQIRDRTAVNENFDATIWGLEFESVFAPTRNLRFNANLGYLDTEIADGEASIDIMNRTQGDPNYTLTKPWLQLPSNCVVPTPVAEAWVLQRTSGAFSMCGGARGSTIFLAATILDPVLGGVYDYHNYPELNGGAGLKDQLGGNELPNAPHWTSNIGGQYGRDVLDGSWRMVLRGDAYWQSQSWARVYNAVNDKLHGWYNVNVSVRLENEALGLEAEFYVKNLLDKSPITDAFLNSDDTGLTTNVFVLDPRLVGFNLRKTF